MPLIVKINSNTLFVDEATRSVGAIKGLVGHHTCCSPDDFYLVSNGKLLRCDADNVLNDGTDSVVHAIYRVRGGKGGFGSMLRALGAQIEKTTNREACRDLSGRRMRDVNNEKKIAEFLQKQSDEQQDRKKRRREKLEKMVNPPKHVVADASYTVEIQKRAETVDDALRQALEKNKKSTASSDGDGKKRKLPTDDAGSKRPCKWLDVDGVSASDNSDDDDSHDNYEKLARQDDTADGRLESTNGDGNSDKMGKQERQPENANDNVEPLKETVVDTIIVASNIKLEPVEETESKISILKSTPPVILKEEKATDAVIPLAGNKEEPQARKSCLSQVSEPSVQPRKATTAETLDLTSFSSADHLESLGLERLKSALMALGLKCGGTLQQRAERLFSTKGVPLDQLDKSLFAKTAKQKKK